jgi:hypothetical protein
MKNVFRLIGFMTLVAVIGFSFAACSKANKVAVTGVTLSNTDLYLTVGGSATVTATVTPADATNKAVVWATGDASVVTVNNGTVTAVGVGTTAIAVATEDGEKIATCAVYVTSTAAAIPAPAPASGGRDSRLVNEAYEAWADSYPEGQRDGFVFKADGTCYVIDDYNGTTPGVLSIYGAAISWTTSGNNILVISFGADATTYTYTVTATTLTLTYGGEVSIYTKAAVTIP